MLYRAKQNGDDGVRACKIIGDIIPLGYEKTAEFFVDSSGFGTESEPALTFPAFLKQVKQGFYYGITSAGQFQVNIREFKKIRRAEQFKQQGIASSKLISKSCRIIKYINGDITIRLYATDILQVKGDKIILSSGGWRTVTTKTRLNQFLNDYHYWVYQKKYKWYVVGNGKKDIEFFDGIELPIIKR